jgi:hypothetical protein
VEEEEEETRAARPSVDARRGVTRAPQNDDADAAIV